MRVQRLAWLGTRTDRYDETTRFFAETLGLESVADEPGLTVFGLPGAENDFVEVFEASHPEASLMTTGPVVGLLVDDVLEARAELEAAGVEILQPTQWLRDFPGFEDVTEYAWFTFRGPDGNVYCCLQGSRRAADD